MYVTKVADLWLFSTSSFPPSNIPPVWMNEQVFTELLLFISTFFIADHTENT